MAASEKFGLYVHFPFCLKKCIYCDFLSFSQWDEAMVNLYSQRLRDEILSLDATHVELDTIYFGGGTPSAISPKVICDVVQTIENHFTLSPNAEKTIEINPATGLQRSFLSYKELGFNRISIGLQSTEDRLLKILGRAHDYHDFLKTYHMLSEMGFYNISVDLMYGLPNQSLSDLSRTIERISALKNIQHISAYSLIVEKHTPLAEKVQAGQLVLPKEKEERKAHYLLRSDLQKRGFNQYEISNYARPGYESRHNTGYWQLKPYYGVGLGAASFIKGIRYRTETDIHAYLTEGDRPNRQVERNCSLQELMEDYVIFGLRMTEGIDCEEFKRKFLLDLNEVFGHSIRELIEVGFLQFREKRLSLTERGQDFENYVDLKLISG